MHDATRSPNRERVTRTHDDIGFTLIEILISIVLVGILSAVVVIGISNLTDKGKSSACVYEHDSLHTAVNIYFANHDVNQIPQDLAAGVTPMDTLRLAGVIDANSKMYSVAPDGTLTPIPGNTNGCGAVPATSPTIAGTTGATTAATTPPNPFFNSPADFVATAGNAQASFTWSPSTTSGFGTIVSYSVTDGHLKSCTVTATNTQMTCTITGLTNDQKYSFQVEANTDTNSSSSSMFSFVTPSAGQPSVAPGYYISGPTGVVAVAGPGTITIRWNPPTSDGGYAITKYWVVDEASNLHSCDVTPPAALECTVSGLANGTTYTYDVYVQNADGWSTNAQAPAVAPHA